MPRLDEHQQGPELRGGLLDLRGGGVDRRLHADLQSDGVLPLLPRRRLPGNRLPARSARRRSSSRPSTLRRGWRAPTTRARCLGAPRARPGTRRCSPPWVTPPPRGSRRGTSPSSARTACSCWPMTTICSSGHGPSWSRQSSSRPTGRSARGAAWRRPSGSPPGRRRLTSPGTPGSTLKTGPPRSHGETTLTGRFSYTDALWFFGVEGADDRATRSTASTASRSNPTARLIRDIAVVPRSRSAACSPRRSGILVGHVACCSVGACRAARPSRS